MSLLSRFRFCWAAKCLLIPSIGLISACANLGPLPTPTGNPEVIILTKDKEAVKNRLADAFASNSYSIVQDTPYKMSFSKQMQGMQSALYQAALGNSYSSTPEIHVNVSLSSSADSTRVFAHVATSMQNAFGREDSVNLDQGKGGREIQALLEQVKAEVEAEKAPKTKSGNKGNYPVALRVYGKPGYILSPYTHQMMDVRGFPSGTEIKDCYTGRIILVP